MDKLILNVQKKDGVNHPFFCHRFFTADPVCIQSQAVAQSLVDALGQDLHADVVLEAGQGHQAANQHAGGGDQALREVRGECEEAVFDPFRIFIWVSQGQI
jgi:hypothetical protein